MPTRTPTTDASGRPIVLVAPDVHHLPEKAAIGDLVTWSGQVWARLRETWFPIFPASPAPVAEPPRLPDPIDLAAVDRTTDLACTFPGCGATTWTHETPGHIRCANGHTWKRHYTGHLVPVDPAVRLEPPADAPLILDQP